MSDLEKQAAEEHAAKKKDVGGGGEAPADDAPPAEEQNNNSELQRLRKENAALKQQVADLQKQLAKLEQEARAAANRTRAEKLVKGLEKKGLEFGDDDARAAEVERLAGLSDEAFAAAEQTYQRLALTASPAKGNESQASQRSTSMNTSANVRPREVDDAPISLEDQLKRGINAAWEDRHRHRLADKE